MYCTSFAVYASKAYPLLSHTLFQKVAEEFSLPQPELLLRSLKSDVDLGVNEHNRLEVHYLDSLTEDTQTDLFQVRFAYSADAREKVALFISFRMGIVHNMTAQFPGRSGRGAFSRMLGHYKSVLHDLRVDARIVECEVQGFTETGYSKYIREHSVSAFVYVERLGRYIHVKENPGEIR